MNFRLLSDSELDYELLKMLSTEATDFAQGENPKYEGWAIETVECDGAEPAICTNKGKIKNLSYTDSNVGIRPVTKYSEIKQNSKVVRRYNNGYIEVEFGEYPQKKLSSIEEQNLTQKLLDCELQKTDKKYTIYNREEKVLVTLQEVMDNKGKKYVLKDGEWYHVSPIRWIVNPKKDLAIAKQMILGGLEYGEYRLPESLKWKLKIEKTLPMKNPPSRRKMFALRKRNKSIIEGFLCSVLPQDIIPSKLKKDKEKYIYILQEYMNYTGEELTFPIETHRPIYLNKINFGLNKQDQDIKQLKK